MFRCPLMREFTRPIADGGLQRFGRGSDEAHDNSLRALITESEVERHGLKVCICRIPVYTLLP